MKEVKTNVSLGGFVAKVYIRKAGQTRWGIEYVTIDYDLETMFKCYTVRSEMLLAKYAVRERMMKYKAKKAVEKCGFIVGKVEMVENNSVAKL